MKNVVAPNLTQQIRYNSYHSFTLIVSDELYKDKEDFVSTPGSRVPYCTVNSIVHLHDVFVYLNLISFHYNQPCKAGFHRNVVDLDLALYCTWRLLCVCLCVP